MPDCSSRTLPSRETVDEDDDLWMNQFGKDPLKKKLLGASVSVDVLSTQTFNGGSGASAKKRQVSATGRLETTTYSFSIGNTETTPKDNIDNDVTNRDNSDDPTAEPWVKRDSKERQPVRKHLKAVNVKSTINVSPDHQQSSPNSSPTVVRRNTKQGVENSRSNDSGISDLTNELPDNRHSSTTSSDSEKDNGPLLVNINTTTQNSSNKLQNITEKSEPLSLSPKHGPVTLPKPKKPLDKKSWTADLIKSKTQKIPNHQPQPGSLNEKLLQQGSFKKPADIEISSQADIKKSTENDTDSANHFQQRSASVGHRSNVRDIRDKFQQKNCALEEGVSTSELSSSVPTTEKYV